MKKLLFLSVVSIALLIEVHGIHSQALLEKEPLILHYSIWQGFYCSQGTSFYNTSLFDSKQITMILKESEFASQQFKKYHLKKAFGSVLASLPLVGIIISPLLFDEPLLNSTGGTIYFSSMLFASLTGAYIYDDGQRHLLEAVNTYNSEVSKFN